MIDFECNYKVLNKRFNNTIVYHIVQFLIKDKSLYINITLVFLNLEIYFKVDVINGLL